MTDSRGGPVRLGELLEGVLEERGLKAQVHRMEVLELWPEIVGEAVAEVARARGVEDATLFVEVRTSAWLMELNMMKGEFLRRVNERLPQAPLDKIVFVLAETE
ncbi:MAG: DciA family protein [Gemmatimonadota bacterium]